MGGGHIMAKFGKTFMAEIRSRVTPEDLKVLFEYGDKWVPPVLKVPEIYGRDIRDMTDEQIERFAQWAMDNGQSVGIGMTATEANLNLFWDMFECRRCGKCCRGPLLDGILLLPSEIRRLAGRMGMHPDKFMDKYVPIKRGPRYGVMAYPCPFFKGNACTIYPLRPVSCLTFPLDFAIITGVEELAVQAFCPEARDFFIWSAKRRKELFGR
jgi:Fe-S-cluster containining protein